MPPGQLAPVAQIDGFRGFQRIDDGLVLSFAVPPPIPRRSLEVLGLD
jgi:hypothetical protein